MVVGCVGHEGHRVDKTHGAVKVWKAEGLLQRAVDQPPSLGPVAIELGQAGDDLGGTECISKGTWGGGCHGLAGAIVF